MEKIKVGEYVRTETGVIGKLVEKISNGGIDYDRGRE